MVESKDMEETIDHSQWKWWIVPFPKIQLQLGNFDISPPILSASENKSPCSTPGDIGKMDTDRLTLVDADINGAVDRVGEEEENVKKSIKLMANQCDQAHPICNCSVKIQSLESELSLLKKQVEEKTIEMIKVKIAHEATENKVSSVEKQLTELIKDFQTMSISVDNHEILLESCHTSFNKSAIDSVDMKNDTLGNNKIMLSEDCETKDINKTLKHENVDKSVELRPTQHLNETSHSEYDDSSQRTKRGEEVGNSSHSNSPMGNSTVNYIESVVKSMETFLDQYITDEIMETAELSDCTNDHRLSATNKDVLKGVVAQSKEVKTNEDFEEKIIASDYNPDNDHDMNQPSIISSPVETENCGVTQIPNDCLLEGNIVTFYTGNSTKINAENFSVESTSIESASVDSSSVETTSNVRILGHKEHTISDVKLEETHISKEISSKAHISVDSKAPDHKHETDSDLLNSDVEEMAIKQDSSENNAFCTGDPFPLKYEYDELKNLPSTANFSKGKSLETRPDRLQFKSVPDSVKSVGVIRQPRGPTEGTRGFASRKGREAGHGLDVGSRVIARWGEDKVWYRAMVEKEDQSRYLVNFIDYGNVEWVTLESVVSSYVEISNKQELVDSFVIEENMLDVIKEKQFSSDDLRRNVIDLDYNTEYTENSQDEFSEQSRRKNKYLGEEIKFKDQENSPSGYNRNTGPSRTTSINLSLGNLLSLNWKRAVKKKERKRMTVSCLVDFLREVVLVDVIEDEFGNIVFQFDDLRNVRNKLRKYTFGECWDLGVIQRLNEASFQADISSNFGYALHVTTQKEIGEIALLDDFLGCSKVIAIPSIPDEKSFEYHLLFPSILYMMKNLTNREICKKYRKIIPNPDMLRFLDERNNANFFKGNICLTEKNILSLVWRSEKVDGIGRWTYNECLSRFFKSSLIKDVVDDCYGDLLVTFTGQDKLEQLLRNFCTSATDSLANVIQATQRASLVDLRGQFTLMTSGSQSAPLDQADFCPYYYCWVSQDMWHLVFQDKLTMVMVLNDPQLKHKTKHIKISPRNIEKVEVSSPRKEIQKTDFFESSAPLSKGGIVEKDMTEEYRSSIKVDSLEISGESDQNMSSISCENICETDGDKELNNKTKEEVKLHPIIIIDC